MTDAHQPKVPTMRAVDHVAYTVPDLDEAIAFFVDHFGAELIFKDGPFADTESDGMRRRLGVDPGARCTLAMLRLGQHHNIELFEYDAPDQVRVPPPNSDVGGHHLAFYVDDIDAGYDYVKAIPGVVVQEGPNGVDPAAPVAGQRWFYFRSPWGMQLELTSCAEGGFYDGLPGARVAPTERNVAVMTDMTLAADSDLRIEEDSMGSRAVPAEAYYGVHTARALENFPISGIPLSTYPEFVNALAAVKQAAALTNCELGLLDSARCAAIVAACDEIRSGRLHSSFVVDVIQGGAGTSSNMNANEVIANRALEHLGAARGDYDRLHPLEHVNRGQSTNDVYPTAIKVALQMYLSELHDALQEVSAAFRAKADEFRDVLKMGRTQLQDAVPMTLGQEFGAYAVMVAEDAQRLREAARLVTEINLGGTAIGTGLNTHPRYARQVCATLSELTGIELSTATDLVEATQDVGAFVQVSGVLKRTAVKLSKICSDLRLLSSGPRSGLGEINLPAVQAGSSIMPGKVNPVIPEVVNQVAFEVVGNDVTISMAAEAGQLQLNAFEPIIAHCLFTSAAHLTAACHTLVQRCIVGITANEARLAASVTNSIGVITALAPYLGYAESARIAKRALHTGAAIPDLVVAQGLMSAERVAQLLAPDALLNPQSTVQPEEETEA